jgi:hypothetical protein
MLNPLTIALLKDLKEDLESLNSKQSNIEVIWELQRMKNTIDFTIKEIKTIIG